MSSPGETESALPPTTPASPAMPAPMAKVTANTSCTLTPEAASMPRSSTPARIIMPTRVFARNHHSPSPMTMAPTSTASR